MTRHKFHMTTTVREHLKEAVREARRNWGTSQARKYNVDFQTGLQSLAKNHRILRSTFRQHMTKGTDFRVHRLEHRYVVFQDHDDYNIVIAGIFHEKMDIPARIQELAMMTQDKIMSIIERIAKSG